MYIPSARERVRVDGLDAIFLVIAVDAIGQTVDLIPLLGAADALENVAFSVLRPYSGEIAAEKKHRRL
jgi:hypothetical protein